MGGKTGRLTRNGKSIEAQKTIIPAKPNAAATDRIAVFMRVVALNIEARTQLVDAVRRVRKLEEDLANPDLKNHPKRPAATRRLPKRQEEERQAVIALSELNAELSRLWDAIPVADKNRYGLTSLIGANPERGIWGVDPEQAIGLVLWCDVGLARLVPFPEGWSVPHDISHRALDQSVESRKTIYTYEELLNSPVAPF